MGCGHRSAVLRAQAGRVPGPHRLLAALEHQIKSLLYSSVRRLSPLGLGSTDPPQEISAVPPDAYGARFRTFIEKAFAE
jgi:hypothetical protein